MFEGFIALDELGRGPQKKELAYFQGPPPNPSSAMKPRFPGLWVLVEIQDQMHH